MTSIYKAFGYYRRITRWFSLYERAMHAGTCLPPNQFAGSLVPKRARLPLQLYCTLYSCIYLPVMEGPGTAMFSKVYICCWMSPGSAKYMRPCLRGKVVRQHSGKMRREFLVPLPPPLLPVIEPAAFGSIGQVLLLGSLSLSGRVFTDVSWYEWMFTVMTQKYRQYAFVFSYLSITRYWIRRLVGEFPLFLPLS